MYGLVPSSMLKNLHRSKTVNRKYQTQLQTETLQVLSYAAQSAPAWPAALDPELA